MVKRMWIQRLAVLVLLPLVLLNEGCAVQKGKAPQIDPKTTKALNVGENLKQLNKDYVTFFTDVGNAQRNGQLTPGQVATLNSIGVKMKQAIEQGNTVFKTYSATYDQSLISQIEAYALDAAQIYAALITNRTQMLSTGGK